MGGRRSDPERPHDENGRTEKEGTEESLTRLGDWLRAETEDLEPDRDRIWARVEASLNRPDAASVDDRPTEPAGPASPHPSGQRGGRLRVAMSSLATAAVVGVVSTVFWQFAGSGIPTRPQADREITLPPTPVSPTPRGSSATGPARPQSQSPSTLPSPTGSPTLSPNTPNSGPSVSSNAPRNGRALLSSRGTIDPNSQAFWAQNNLTLQVRSQLHALTVTIRVLRTDERIQATGSWLSLPNGDFHASAEPAAGAIVFTWTLLAGRTVQPGTYTLAAQYNRTAAHDPRKDSYTVRGSSLSNQPITANGHF